MTIRKSFQAPRLIHIKGLIIACNSHMRIKAGTTGATQDWFAFPNSHILLILLQCQANTLTVM